ncbi:STAS domain-containing protein [Roseivivax sp. CAU 1753]
MTLVIDLPEKLDTAMANGLARRLVEAAEGRIAIDGQRVQSLGTLCAQLLLAARQRALSNGHEFELAASEAMRDDLRLLGLDSLATRPGAKPSGDMS